MRPPSSPDGSLAVPASRKPRYSPASRRGAESSQHASAGLGTTITVSLSPGWLAGPVSVLVWMSNASPSRRIPRVRTPCGLTKGKQNPVSPRLSSQSVAGTPVGPVIIPGLILVCSKTRCMVARHVGTNSWLSEWNHQAFANDLSIYVSKEHDAQTLLDLVAEFQEWSGLKISIKKNNRHGCTVRQGGSQTGRDGEENGSPAGDRGEQEES